MFNFKFNNLSKKEETKTEAEENRFKPEEFIVSAKIFYEKRRLAQRSYVLDVRSTSEFEEDHLPGAHSIPIEDFEDSVYQMPFSGDILLYGGKNGEVHTAGEILYDNGFDNFFFVDSYEELCTPDASLFTITEEAKNHIQNLKNSMNPSFEAMRIVAEAKTPMKAKYHCELVRKEELSEEETIVPVEGIDVYIHKKTIPYLEGTVVNVIEGKLEATNSTMGVSDLKGSLEERVRQILEEQINPMVAMHDGVIDLLEIKDDTVYLEFGGGCKGCGMVDVTLKQGVEVIFKENLPEISKILDVTDHAEGTNPYYAPSSK